MFISGSCIILGFTLFISIYSWLPESLNYLLFSLCVLSFRKSTSFVFHKENLKQSPRFSSTPPDLNMKVTNSFGIRIPQKIFWGGEKNPFFNLCNLRSPGRREKLREVPKKTELTGERRAGRELRSMEFSWKYSNTHLFPVNVGGMGSHTRTCWAGVYSLLGSSIFLGFLASTALIK